MAWSHVILLVGSATQIRLSNRITWIIKVSRIPIVIRIMPFIIFFFHFFPPKLSRLGIYISLFLLRWIEAICLNTSYLTDSFIVFTLKMESVLKNTIFGLKMMVKSGLEKIILKSLHAGR